MKPTNTIKIGVSSCLLGNTVRYDGKHKYNSVLVSEFGPDFELIPFCPEIAIGMPVPRPPIQLISLNDEIRVVDRENTALDYTQQIRQLVNKYRAENAAICGFVFQEKSPSCGYQSTKVHDVNGTLLHEQGSGLFAAGIHDMWPEMPLIESQDLDNKVCLERFISAVKTYAANHYPPD